MIHPHTYIHPNARLATNVKIDPFTVIHQDVVVGEGTWIGSNVTIMEGARIGKNCRIFPGAVISAIPQDLKFEDERTTVEIGDNTTIREFVTINRGTKDMEKTTIGYLPEEEVYDERGLEYKVEEIKKAVKELPNGYRTVLTLHLFEGYDQEEIAEILQVSHVTVRTQYMRAKQKLLQLIKQGGLL